MPAPMTPEDEAFERGKREAFLISQLDDHERRLRAINGSIDRHARETASLRNRIVSLSDKIDDLQATLATRAAVEHARAEELHRANEQQISNRTFWLGVFAIIATLLAALIASHGGVFA